MEGIREGTQINLVFNYVKTTSFYVLLETFKMHDIKIYMYQLLTALKTLASYCIVHRDVKPSNFLYSVEEKSGYLIDFGLSEIVIYYNQIYRKLIHKIKCKEMHRIQMKLLRNYIKHS